MNNFYRRLAITNMKNNKQFYLPYIFTSVISVMLFYCMNALSLNDGLKNVRGGTDVIFVMKLGVVVIAILVSILIFYTNSYIMKRRKKELGVYNILGMEKKHLAVVLLWETMTSFGIAVGTGLICGIAFHKYFSMILYKITGLDESIKFYVCGKSCIRTICLFCTIYFVTFIYNILQIKLANPIELLHSSNAGEKEPKTKILMTIIGVICLGAGYYIALNVKDPIAAITWFFIAVILVIVGTYALFTSGSIAFLKALRKNRNYYYQTRHFTSVSGMIYRMKQNAVGLGNICILSTMVLVMVSSTVSLYVGLEDFIDTLQPADVNVKVMFDGIPSKDTIENIETEINRSIEATNTKVTDNESYMDFSFAGLMKDDELIYGGSTEEHINYTDSIYVEMVTKEEYEKKYKEKLPDIEPNELCIFSEIIYGNDTINIHGLSYKVAQAEGRKSDSQFADIVKDYITIVVSNDKVISDIFERLCSVHVYTSIIPVPYVNYEFNYNIDGEPEEQKVVSQAINNSLSNWPTQSEATWSSPRISTKADLYESYLMSNGSLLFLGLFLGLMFLIITVLIIYYKQISEGYEDRERFIIMQKVGMSNKEVKDAIRSQVRTVFFLPLITANIHLLVAFPMIKKILELMFVSNTTIIVVCLIGTVVVFGLIYYMVFKITSRSYYKIVGNNV